MKYDNFNSKNVEQKPKSEFEKFYEDNITLHTPDAPPVKAKQKLTSYVIDKPVKNVSNSDRVENENQIKEFISTQAQRLTNLYK